MPTSHHAALITGASSGIGATYADRFARRDYDLVLVARDAQRMETLAARLRDQTGVAIDILPADLTNHNDLARVEARLREDARIDLLVNNAGIGDFSGFASPDLDAVENLIRLNIVAVVRLAGAAIPRLLARGNGAIINIGSILGLAPELLPGVYSATKSFVLTFSQSLRSSLAPAAFMFRRCCPPQRARRSGSVAAEALIASPT
jgi:uncharacterized protein